MSKHKTDEELEKEFEETKKQLDESMRQLRELNPSVDDKELDELYKAMLDGERERLFNKNKYRRKRIIKSIFDFIKEYFIYVIVYAAMYGFCATGIKVSETYILFIYIAVLAVYQLSSKRIIGLLVKKIGHPISLFIATIVFNIMVLYFANKMITVFTYESISYILFFYLGSEIINSMVKYYMIKYRIL